MQCRVCGIEHRSSAICERLNDIARSLELYAIPAFLTDTYNRFASVNRPFARLIGDPIDDGLSPNLRFIATAMLGPYRDRFPRRRAELASCLPRLTEEIEAGQLAPATRYLVEEVLALDADLRQLAERTTTPWDGTIVIKKDRRELVLVREQVIPVADIQGHPNGYHISLWLPAEKEVPACLSDPVRTHMGAIALLTKRQLEIARWYAMGLSSREVAGRAKIAHRTARDHLEEIYSRLDVHSRAELAALLVREGLV